MKAKSYKEPLENSNVAPEAILSEGYSLILQKFISAGFGYVNFVLFKYELIGFSKSERMRFYYSLYGRGKEDGMLKQLKAIKFSETILLCPIKKEDMMKEYLGGWKIRYKEFPIMVPERIAYLQKLTEKFI